VRLRGVPLLAVLGLAAAAVVGARSAPLRQVPVSAPVRLPAAAVTPVTVCPGPETQLAPAGSQPLAGTGTTVVAAAVARAPAGGRLTSLSPAAAAAGTTSPAGTTSATSDLAPATDGVSVASTVRSGAGAVRLDAKRAAAAGAAAVAAAIPPATQLTWGRSGDLRALVATTCAGPVDDAWLVGGGTDDGRRARLLLANPGAAPCVVDLTVLGPDGARQPAAGQGVVVAAHAEIALYLDALTPQLSSLAVHVQARTGRFVAVLQDSLMRGITPGGVDDLSAVAPARRQLLTGLVRKAPGTVTVTVAVPGDRDAVVRLRLLGTDAGVDLPDGVVTVAAHSVKDVVLPAAVGDGTWTAALSSDVDVVASAMSWVSRPGGENAGTAAGLGKQVPVSDLAWSPAGAPLTGDVLLALPTPIGSAPIGSGTKNAPTVHAQLVLANGDDADPAGAGADLAAEVVAVTLLAADGSTTTRSVTVAVGRTVTVAVPDGTTAIRLAAGAAGAHLVGAVQLSATDAAGPLLAVLPMRSGPGAAEPAPAVVADPRLG
jgi:Family of unknown function (DUF5719)